MLGIDHFVIIIVQLSVVGYNICTEIFIPIYLLYSRAFLSKPELIYSLLDPDTLKYIYEKHPSICEAAYQLCAAIHEEKTSAKGNGEETLAPFAFNMDEDSDDEDEAEDMDTGDVNR